MHGGTLHASSDGLGKGSTFFLRLPVVLPVNLPVESFLMKTHELQSPPMTNKHKNIKPVLDRPVQRKIVLVVDDNVDAANTLNTLLGLDGFTVTTVYDGAQAVAAVEAHVPDIVVMDIGMPHMDGYEAARQMRKRYSHGSLLLIALTGWGQTSDIDRAMAAGFDHHMVKPVDYEQLLQCFGGSSMQRLADSVALAP